MYKLYRLMCQKEFDSVCEKHPISWNGKFKWFTDNPEFLNRVADNAFNNSKFKSKYTHLVVYEFSDLVYTRRVSTNELMLRRRDQPLVEIKLIEKVGIDWRNKCLN